MILFHPAVDAVNGYIEGLDGGRRMAERSYHNFSAVYCFMQYSAYKYCVSDPLIAPKPLLRVW